MTNLDSIFKSRDITLPRKVRLVKAMVFPVVHRCEETDSWRAQTKFCVTRTQEKGAVTPQESKPDLPVGVQESLAEAGPIVGSGTLNTILAAP